MKYLNSTKFDDMRELLRRAEKIMNRLEMGRDGLTLAVGYNPTHPKPESMDFEGRMYLPAEEGDVTRIALQYMLFYTPDEDTEWSVIFNLRASILPLPSKTTWRRETDDPFEGVLAVEREAAQDILDDVGGCCPEPLLNWANGVMSCRGGGYEGETTTVTLRDYSPLYSDMVERDQQAALNRAMIELAMNRINTGVSQVPDDLAHIADLAERSPLDISIEPGDLEIRDIDQDAEHVEFMREHFREQATLDALEMMRRGGILTDDEADALVEATKRDFEDTDE